MPGWYWCWLLLTCWNSSKVTHYCWKVVDTYMPGFSPKRRRNLHRDDDGVCSRWGVAKNRLLEVRRPCSANLGSLRYWRSFAKALIEGYLVATRGLEGENLVVCDKYGISWAIKSLSTEQTTIGTDWVAAFQLENRPANDLPNTCYKVQSTTSPTDKQMIQPNYRTPVYRRLPFLIAFVYLPSCSESDFTISLALILERLKSCSAAPI